MDISTIKLFTATETAKILKTSRNSIYRYIQEGKIHAYYLDDEDPFFREAGRRPKVLIPAWAIEEFLKLNTPDHTIEKLKKHKNLLKEWLTKYENEDNPEILKEALQKVISIID